MYVVGKVWNNSVLIFFFLKTLITFCTRITIMVRLHRSEHSYYE